MTDQKYEVRKLVRSDLKGLPVLISEVLGTETDETHLEWKYFSGADGRCISTVALSGERIIGFLGAIPVRFSIGGKEVIAAEEADLAILPEYRRLDLSLKMYGVSKKTFAEEDIAFVYGITSKATSEFNKSLLGKKEVAPVPRHVRVLNSRPYLARKISNGFLLAAATPLANALLSLKYRKKSSVPDGMRIVAPEKFDGRFDALWERIKGDHPVARARDAAYLNWRYADVRNKGYNIFCLEREISREIASFMVLRVKEEGWARRGQIMELVSPRGQGSQALAPLIDLAVGHFRRKRADSIECWMFPHNHGFAELARRGFAERKKKHLNLHVQDMRPELAEQGNFLTGSGNWRISIGDSDLG